MTLNSLNLRILLLLVPLVALCNTYLYLYPAFHRCHFAAPYSSNGEVTPVAPFRLLAFGDPQLEGDTSLPKKPRYSSIEWKRVVDRIRHGRPRAALDELRVTLTSVKDVFNYHAQYARKQLDLLGNDYYLAHIYRTLHWYTDPTHVTVLGDLLGSQWINDEEFHRRSWRFWNRVFKGSAKVPDEIMMPESSEDSPHLIYQDDLGGDQRWRNWIINVPGNHDIGYAGDLEEDRVARFEREFGAVNGDIRFRLWSGKNTSLDATHPTIRLVALNTMNLDSPQLSYDLAVETIDFVNRAIGASKPVHDHSEAVILLTHIPLHKEAGICTDGPFFSYFPPEEGSGIKEQNLLSYNSGRDAVLQGLFGKHPSSEGEAKGIGRDGIILTGHDHVGCEVYHWADREKEEWQANRWSDPRTATLVADDNVPGIREVTVRSMMGEFGGNAALISAWWDMEYGRWKFEVSNCRLGVQHIWWAIHILNLITLCIAAWTLVARVISVAFPSQPERVADGAKPQRLANGNAENLPNPAAGKQAQQNGEAVEDTVRKKG